MTTTPKGKDGKVSKSAHLTGGSRKGKPNKATAELKDMILKALDGAGGVDYLVDRAIDPRTASAFLSLVGRVLPMTVAGDKDNPLTVITKIERVIVSPKH